MNNKINTLLKFHWLFFVFSIIAAGFFMYGAKNLTPESDYKIFFSKDDPTLLAQEKIEDTYTKSDNVTFIVSSNLVSPKNEDLFSKQNIKALHELTEASWQLPYSFRVDSITNFQHTESIDDDLFVGDLVPNEKLLDVVFLEKAKNISTSQRETVNRLISTNAKTAAVVISLELSDDQKEIEKRSFEVVDAARIIKDDFAQKYPNLEFRLVGQTVVIAAFNELTQRDISTLFPIMLGLAFLLLVILLKSFSYAISTFIVLIISIAAAMGLSGYLGFSINQINATTPIIILTLAICDCVHIFNTFNNKLAQNMSKLEAIRCSLQSNFTAVFLTSLTTAIGFASMNFSDSPPFQSLGTMAAIGVCFAFIFSITLLPTLILIMPTSKVTEKKANLLPSKLSDFVISNYKKILSYGLLSCILISAFTYKNDFNDSTLGYFKPSVPFREASDFMQANLTGFDQISYSLDSGTASGVNDPEFLESVNQFSEWLNVQPEVVSVISYTDIIKRLNKNMHNDNNEWYKIPESKELAAQYQLLYELSLPYGLDLNNVVNSNKSALKITAIIKDQKAKGLIELDKRSQAWLKVNAPDLQTAGAGISLMFANIGQNNIKSMLKGSALAAVLITLILIMSLRSLKNGLISIIPNTLPVFVALGFWGIVVSEVNLAVAAIFSITLGIVVDDTVHFMSKFLHASKKLMKTTEDSIRYAFDEVSNALITTSIVLGIGFLALAFSDFNVNSYMGIMVSMTIAIALLFDLLILPSLLLLFNRK